MTQLYDLMVLTAPQAAAEGKEKFKDNVDSVLTKQKVNVVSCEEWGEKGLAFPVAKYDRGMYFVYGLEMDSKQAVAVNSKLKMEKGVLRHLLVKRAKVKNQAEAQL